MDVSEATLQFVVKVFSVLVGIIVVAVVGLLIFVIIRDGNSALVSESYSNLVQLAQWGLSIIGGVIVGKPIATGIGNLLQGKGVQASTSNVPIVPNTIPVQTVDGTPAASQAQSSQAPSAL